MQVTTELASLNRMYQQMLVPDWLSQQIVTLAHKDEDTVAAAKLVTNENLKSFIKRAKTPEE
jgi:hypothetical protein